MLDWRAARSSARRRWISRVAAPSAGLTLVSSLVAKQREHEARLREEWEKLEAERVREREERRERRAEAAGLGRPRVRRHSLREENGGHHHCH